MSDPGRLVVACSELFRGHDAVVDKLSAIVAEPLDLACEVCLAQFLPVVATAAVVVHGRTRVQSVVVDFLPLGVFLTSFLEGFKSILLASSYAIPPQ